MARKPFRDSARPRSTPGDAPSQPDAASAAPGPSPAPPPSPEHLRRDLEARGVDPLFADAVLAQVELAAPSGGLSWEAIVEGVEVAYRVHCNGQENVRRSLRDLTEAARLLEDFDSELRKLDEGLKALAAYLVRMRRSLRRDGPGLLH